jgi:hypothetical protein
MDALTIPPPKMIQLVLDPSLLEESQHFGWCNDQAIFRFVVFNNVECNASQELTQSNGGNAIIE